MVNLVRPLALVLFASLLCACERDADATAAVELKLGPSASLERTFEAVTSLAEYIEVPGAGNELRLTIASYDADCDAFKPINDRHGHDVGDAVLRDVGTLLGGSLRQRVDAAYRVGGDEFAVLLPGADAAQAVDALVRARTRLPAGTTLARHGVTLSIGAVALRPDEAAAELGRRADRLMYAAKQRVDADPADAVDGRAARC